MLKRIPLDDYIDDDEITLKKYILDILDVVSMT